MLNSERRSAGAPVSLPMVRSKRPGTVALDNAAISDIAFPDINVWVALGRFREQAQVLRRRSVL